MGNFYRLGNTVLGLALLDSGPLGSYLSSPIGCVSSRSDRKVVSERPVLCAWLHCCRNVDTRSEDRIFYVYVSKLASKIGVGSFSSSSNGSCLCQKRNQMRSCKCNHTKRDVTMSNCLPHASRIPEWCRYHASPLTSTWHKTLKTPLPCKSAK